MMDIEYVKQCVIVNSASAVRDEILDIIERLLTAEQERDQYKAELQECAHLLGEMQVSEHQKHLELESLRAKIKEAPHWVAIDCAEDAPTDDQLVLFDGCDISVDYVECEVDYGTSFFANGTEATHYLANLTLPPEITDEGGD